MSDTLDTIKCPACQKEMAKVFVPSEGVNIDICVNGCGGIYFDVREFEHFDEQHEDIDEIIKAIDGKTFKPVDDTLPRSCPVCGSKMAKHYASAKHEILIDECYSCGGKFLDHGELQKIREQYVTEDERTADIMKYIHREVGAELKALNDEAEKLRAERSILKKLYDKIFDL